MITVLLLGRPTRGFYCKGHSGYAGRGKDIVCAGVSTMTWAAYRSLRHHGIRCRYARDDAKGMFCVLASPDGDQAMACDIIFTTMRLGILALSSGYPAYVRIIPQDGGGENDV